MGNVFNKTCYFIINNQLYRGKILKNKKNKYLIKSQSKLSIHNDYSDIICIKKEEVMFKESDIRIQNLIEDMSSKYLADVLTNSLTPQLNSLPYHLFVQRLITYFPRNKTIIEMRDSLKRNYPI